MYEKLEQKNVNFIAFALEHAATYFLYFDDNQVVHTAQELRPYKFNLLTEQAMALSITRVSWTSKATLKII